jgi:hypothetical protein
MSHRLLRVLAILFVIPGCLGQTSIANKHVKQLIEHWRWKQYWDGNTELRAMYSPGREFQALLFWRTNEVPPSVGFCSTDLLVCQFYPDTSMIDSSYELKVPLGYDSHAAFRSFLMASFGQNDSLLTRPPKPKETDYTIELVKIALPALDPPEAIRDRKQQPRAETEALTTSLGCLPDQPGCKVHLLIPFYSHKDPCVPVFRKCSMCSNPKPMIVFMRFVEGNWWHGATDFNDRPRAVARTRRQIQNALMIEVNR